METDFEPKLLCFSSKVAVITDH